MTGGRGLRPPGSAHAVLLLAALAAATPLHAQVTSSLEVGTGSGHTDGFLSSQLVTLAPRLDLARGPWHFASSGVYSDYGTSLWNADGWAQTWFSAGPARWLQVDLAVGAHATRHSATSGTTLLEGGMRVRAGGPARGAWLSGSRAVSYVNGSRDPFFRLDLGAWNRFGPVGLRVSMRRNDVGDGVLRPDVYYPEPTPGRDTLVMKTLRSFSDIAAEASWTSGRLGVAAGIGRRVSSREFQLTTWNLRTSFQLTPVLALLGAVGHYAPDLTSGLLGGRYATMSVRVNLLGSGPVVGAGTARPVPQAFVTHRLPGDMVLLSLRAEGRVSNVEIMGDFTDWLPVPLDAVGGGWWEAAVVVPPGPHRLNVRFDGGAWQVPAGTTPVADDFGGVAGQFSMEGA